MGPMSNKRARSEKSEPPAKKRKKTQNFQGASNAVVLDALPWNEVTFPERFEDAEGFFGLEEISDVEVFRDQSFGKVEYRVKAGKVPQLSGGDAQQENAETNGHNTMEGDHDQEMDWEGIEGSEMQSNEGASLKTGEAKALERKNRRNAAKV